jgi:hypothetical protein
VTPSWYTILRASAAPIPDAAPVITPTLPANGVSEGGAAAAAAAAAARSVGKVSLFARVKSASKVGVYGPTIAILDSRVSFST